MVSGSLGIGGGILKVPLLNAWCGVPLRAAAATSALMIGVTAASAPIQYANHYIQPPLAAAAVLGVLAGSRFGLWFGGRAKARWLKLLLATILALVSIVHFAKVLWPPTLTPSRASKDHVGRLFTVGVAISAAILAVGLALFLATPTRLRPVTFSTPGCWC